MHADFRRLHYNLGFCFNTGLWRNGSASDSRSEGWEFESLWPHYSLRPWLLVTETSHSSPLKQAPYVMPGARQTSSSALPACMLIFDVFTTIWAFASTRGYGATAARLTPDQKVGSSNLSALIFFLRSAEGISDDGVGMFASPNYIKIKQLSTWVGLCLCAAMLML